MLIVIAVLVDAALERREFHSALVLRTVAVRGQFLGALLDMVIPLRRFHDLINQPPVFCSLALNAFRHRTKNVCKIAADFALIGYTRQPSRSGKDAQQRNLRQAHG